MVSLLCDELPDAVKRKILVLDLDETLIHSHHDGVLRPTVRPGTPPDFILKVRALGHACTCWSANAMEPKPLSPPPPSSTCR